MGKTFLMPGTVVYRPPALPSERDARARAVRQAAQGEWANHVLTASEMRPPVGATVSDVAAFWREVDRLRTTHWAR